MINETDRIREATLDDLLIRWHQWQRIPMPRGHAHRAMVVGDYISRSEFSNDDEAGALDEHLDHRRMSQVDFEVRQMVDPYQSAIYVVARALTVGVMVFTSPRLPLDPQERVQVCKTARVIACRRFTSAGLL